MTKISPTREVAAVLDIVAARDLLKKLSELQRRFLRLRFLHDTDTAAATAAGCSAAVVKTWKRNPDFVDAYNAILIDPIIHASAELALVAPEAAGVIRDVLLNGRDADRLKAAEQILRSKPVQLVGPASLRIEGDGDGGAVTYLRLMAELRRIKGLPVAGFDDGEYVEGQVRIVNDLPSDEKSDEKSSS